MSIAIATWVGSVAQCLIFIAALFALRQLSITKQGNEQIEKRAALTFTADQMDRFRIMLDEEFDVIMRVLHDNKIDLKNFKMKEFSKEELDDESKTNRGLQSALKNYGQFLGVTDPKVYDLVSRIMNKFEVMATGFVENLGDKSVAYPILGPVFCDFIEQHFVLYCFNRTKEKRYFYSNTICLYQEWSKQLLKDKLETQKATIEAKLSVI